MNTENNFVVRNEVANENMLKHGISVYHNRFLSADNDLVNNGGQTIAYKVTPTVGNHTVIEIAQVQCSVKDSYNKKIGKTLAVESFIAGNTIVIKTPKFYLGYERDLIKRMFNVFTYSG